VGAVLAGLRWAMLSALAMVRPSVGSCASSPTWDRAEAWTKAGISADAVWRDVGECFRTATSPARINSKGLVVMQARVSEERLSACMRSRGYTPRGRWGNAALWTGRREGWQAVGVSALVCVSTPHWRFERCDPGGGVSEVRGRGWQASKHAGSAGQASREGPAVTYSEWAGWLVGRPAARSAA
jgi:hypothetical protein